MKKKLKIICIIIVIIAVLIIAWQLSLFVRVKNIEKKTFENFTGDYYYKVTSNSGMTKEYWVNDDYSVINLNKNAVMWYDKKNSISATLPNGGDTAILEYRRDSETPFHFVDMFSNGYTPYITYWDLQGIGWIFNSYGSLFEKIGDVFQELVETPLLTVKSITTETVNGKECYKIELRDMFIGAGVYYIDKENYLPIRTIDKTVTQGYSEDPKIEIYMEEYEYSFEPIKNESLNIPNLEDCYVVVQE